MGTAVKVWRAYFPRWTQREDMLTVEELDGIETAKRVVVKDGSFNQHVLPDSIHRTEEDAVQALAGRLDDNITKLKADLAKAQRQLRLVDKYLIDHGWA
jgi:hypothetical protein